MYFLQAKVTMKNLIVSGFFGICALSFAQTAQSLVLGSSAQTALLQNQGAHLTSAYTKASQRLRKGTSTFTQVTQNQATNQRGEAVSAEMKPVCDRDLDY